MLPHPVPHIATSSNRITSHYNNYTTLHQRPSIYHLHHKHTIHNSILHTIHNFIEYHITSLHHKHKHNHIWNYNYGHTCTAITTTRTLHATSTATSTARTTVTHIHSYSRYLVNYKYTIRRHYRYTGEPYLLGNAGSDNCPATSMQMWLPSQCEDAASYHGVSFEQGSWFDVPNGCFWGILLGTFYFNEHDGSAKDNTKTVCLTKGLRI